MADSDKSGTDDRDAKAKNDEKARSPLTAAAALARHVAAEQARARAIQERFVSEAMAHRRLLETSLFTGPSREREATLEQEIAGLKKEVASLQRQSMRRLPLRRCAFPRRLHMQQRGTQWLSGRS